MSTFWKPTTPDNPLTWRDGTTKRLGTGLYVLWARCDLCFRSGPSTQFVFWESQSELSTICGACDEIVQAEGDLARDGWHRRG